MSLRGRTGRGERGAAAVELGLVSLLLFPILLGILQYGLWFNDSLNLRQGVREAARAGVVENFDHRGCTGDDMAKLACRTKQEIGAMSGDSFVRIVTPGGWTKAEPLIVCAMVRSTALGLVPLPHDGLIRSRTEMSIEVTEATPSSLTYSDTAPAGGSWSWCD